MRTRMVTLGVLALSLVGAEASMAQAGPRGRDARGPEVAPMLDVRVGRAMDRRHELGLTDEQFEGLARLRTEASATLAPARTRLREIAGALREGTMARADAREELTALRETIRTTQQELGGRLGELLDEDQRARLRGGGRAGLIRDGRRGQIERGAAMGRRGIGRSFDCIGPRGRVDVSRRRVPARRFPPRSGPGG